MQLGQVAIDVLINQWNNRFYNALQERNWDTFVSELLFFSVLAFAGIAIAIYQLYLNQWLQIRWRRWMTQRYLGAWLDGPTHYRMQLRATPPTIPTSASPRSRECSSQRRCGSVLVCSIRS